MKRIFTGLFCALLAHTTFAQSLMPKHTMVDYRTTGTANNAQANFSGELWSEREMTDAKNTNTWGTAGGFGGAGSFSRGENPNKIVLIMEENMSGEYQNFRTSTTGQANKDTTTIDVQNDDLVFKSFDHEAVLVYTESDSLKKSAGSTKILGGGNWFGGAGHAGMAFKNGRDVQLDKVSVYGGETNISAFIPGISIAGMSGSAKLNLEADDRVVAGRVTKDYSPHFGEKITVATGDGLSVHGVTNVISVVGGQFQGAANPDSVYTIGFSSPRALSQSGSGAKFVLGGKNLSISNGVYQGGNVSGAVIAGGPNAQATVIAGAGAYIDEISTSIKISNSTFIAGTNNGVAAIVPAAFFIKSKSKAGKEDKKDKGVEQPASDVNGEAIATGGIGLQIESEGTATLIDVTATGSHGGIAAALGTNSNATATGGHGVYKNGGKLIIKGKDGVYTGGDGGEAYSSNNGNAYADGGAGAFAINGAELNITGGTFSGGKSGTANDVSEIGNVGIWLQDSSLKLSGITSNTTINGDIYSVGTINTMSIFAGVINGDIIKSSMGDLALSVKSNAVLNGTFVQHGGTVTVNIGNSTDGMFFSNVSINEGVSSAGLLNFEGTQKVITKENSTFVLEDASSVLSFLNGAYLSNGSSINAGYGTVSSAADLELGENSSISLALDTTFDSTGALDTNLDGGSLDMTGGKLILSNSTARIYATGTSAKSSGSVQLSTGGLDTTGTDLNNMVEASFGWLTEVTNVTNSSGILVEFGYNSLTNNSTLSDLDSSLLSYVDDILTNSTSEMSFYKLNADGEEKVVSQLRHSLTQLPDASESTFQLSRQVNQQMAARGTEFRSMNGFASTKPNRSNQVQPTGVAGPDEEKNGTMKGWVRGYGSFGDKDKTDKFSAYDSSSWGTVIGIDQSFGNLLIGVAGGYAHTDLDAGSSYQADVDTYHGSIYSTIGGESVFIDLAATYGIAKTEERNDLTTADFDSDIFSLYIGAGKSFNVKDKISITPEASLLASYYKQEEYDRTGTLSGTVKEYDTSSYLGSIGVNISTQHQIDWFKNALAFIPEVRAHWLHDFNSNPDDFMYSVGGGAFSPSAVRTRDEDLFRVGFGFDVWNWTYERAKFEVDYNGLFSSTYQEHIFSGKATLQF